MREIRTLRAMGRGLETTHGSDTGHSQRKRRANSLGRAYGAWAPVLDPTRGMHSHLSDTERAFRFRALWFARGFQHSSA